MRLVGVQDGHRYVVDITWPDHPLPATTVQALADTARADTQHVILCLSGFGPDITTTGFTPASTTPVVLLDRAHLDALVCGLFTPASLLDSAFDQSFLTSRAYVPLIDLLRQSVPQEPPAPMVRPDQLPPPWPVISETAPSIEAQVVLVGDAGWSQPLGLATHHTGNLLITTDRGLLELDPHRGTTFWLLRLPDCQGPPLPLPDGSILILCRGTVLRYHDEVLEPIAGSFPRPAMLLTGPDGEPWVLSGTAATIRGGTSTLALTRLGSHIGQQHRFAIHFEAAIQAAGWLEHRRFFLAAKGHSAVVDLNQSSTVTEDSWIPFSHHYPGALLVLDPTTVITMVRDGSGLDVSLFRTDVTTGHRDLAARLTVNRIIDITHAGDGRAYLLADVQGNTVQPAPILVRLSGLPRLATDQPQPAAPRRVSTGWSPDPYGALRQASSGRRRDYRLDPHPIERGGQAEVFAAVHKPTGTPVAFKRLTAPNPDAVARMRREVDIAQRLGGHPAVMPVLDHGDDDSWFVMPLAEGTAETLLFDDLAEPAQLRTMILAVCDALRAAHGQDWLHRDIKPANVLKLDGRWVLADWGLARRPRGHTTNPNRTRTGVLIGTEGFAAPELSQNAHTAGPTADIYSLGQLIGWALLQHWPQPNIPLIPPDEPWRAVVHAATQYDPAQRPATIDAFLAMLETTSSR